MHPFGNGSSSTRTTLTRARGAVTGMLVVLAASVTACTSALGVTDVPGETCGGYTATDDCDACVNVVCCSQQVTCLTDPACVAISNCVNQCAKGSSSDFSSCANACGQQNPSAIDEYDAYFDCFGSCGSACGVTSTAEGSSSGSSGGTGSSETACANAAPADFSALSSCLGGSCSSACPG
jgi:hypothetical protein